MIETLKITVRGNRGDEIEIPTKRNEPIIDIFGSDEGIVNDEWKKKMEQKFYLIEDKVTKKVIGINLSFEYMIFESWNLPSDFKMPKMAKFKGVGNPSIHAQHYLHLMAPLGLTKEKVALLFGPHLMDPPLSVHSLTPCV